MTERTLFGDVVKALQIANGPITVAGITRMTGRPMEYVEREIKRIRQCGPFKRWIQYLPATKEFALIEALQKCPHESLLYLIKDLYKHTSDFDTNMDLRKTAEPPKEVPKATGVLTMTETRNTSASNKKQMFDFSTIKF